MLQVGQPLYGFCGGYLDDLGYSDEKRIEAVGHDWIVVRDNSGKLGFVAGKEELSFIEETCTSPENITEI